MAEFSIRQMKKSDLGSVGKLFKDVFNTEGEEWSAETAAAHVKQNFFGNSHWVAIQENEVIGFLMAIVLTREKGDELFVDSIVVKESFQKQGIGSALWESAEKYVESHKLKGLRLLANPSLNSFEWYKKMGYKKSGWIELYKEC